MQCSYDSLISLWLSTDRSLGGFGWDAQHIGNYLCFVCPMQAMNRCISPSALTPSGSVPRAGEGMRRGANLPCHRLHPDGGSVRHTADLLLRHVHSHRVRSVRLHVLLPPLPCDLVQISSLGF